MSAQSNPSLLIRSESKLTEKSTSLLSLNLDVRIEPNTHNLATLYLRHKAIILSIFISINFMAMQMYTKFANFRTNRIKKSFFLIYKRLEFENRWCQLRKTAR